MKVSEEDGASSDIATEKSSVGAENRQGPFISHVETLLFSGRVKHSLMHKSAKYQHEGEQDATSWLSHKSHVIVFTYSGKPVYTRYGSEELIAGFTGTLQALMSKVAVLGLNDNGGDDQLKSIKMGDLEIVFLDRSPLILVSICKLASVPMISNVRLLKAVHSQLMFILTGGVNRTLLDRPSFDVRSLLGGTKPLLCNLISWMHRDMFLGIEECAIEPLPLPFVVRQKWLGLLQSHTPSFSIFSFLLSGYRVIATSSAPTIAPLVSACDIVLLINLVISSTSLRSGESWTPVCLPSISTDAFVYAYVQYVSPEIAYVCLSLSSENENFYAISAECQSIQDFIVNEELAADVSNWTLKCPLTLKSESSPAILSHVRHCSIVLNNSGQYFSSQIAAVESPRGGPRSIKEVFRNYATCLSTILAQSASKQVSMTTETDFVFVWITTEFQFFLTAPRGIDIAIITFVYQWIRDNEQTLFLPNLGNSSESGTRLNLAASSLW